MYLSVLFCSNSIDASTNLTDFLSSSLIILCKELIESIVPRQVALKLYTASLSALASEHAARMVAMQAATDNADDLIGELSVEYNKQRQQAITTELLDIMGGQNR